MQNLTSLTSCLRLTLIAFILSLCACSFPGVYKINVQQGNIVTQDMLDKLKPGMTKRQVHFALGNPIVNNVFDTSEDVYLYTYQLAGGETQTQKIIVFYTNDLFDRYEGQPLEDQPAY